MRTKILYKSILSVVLTACLFFLTEAAFAKRGDVKVKEDSSLTTETEIIRVQTAPKEPVVVSKPQRQRASKAVSKAETVVEPAAAVATETVVAEQPENKDTQLIDSLLSAPSFPEKSQFIEGEDKKDLEKSKETQSPSKELAAVQSQTTNSMATTMFLATLLIGAILCVLAYLWRRVDGKSFKLFPANGKLKIIAHQPISLRSKVLIIEALGKKYLIGATQDRIQLLADLDFYGNHEGKNTNLTPAEGEDFLDEAQSGASFFKTLTSEANKSTDSSVGNKSQEKKSIFVPITESFQKEESEKEPVGTQKVMGRIKDRLKELKKFSSTH